MIYYNIVIKFGIHTQLFQLLPTKNGLKGDALLSLLFNFALEYAIRKVKAEHKFLKCNGTHQFIIYANDVNLQGHSTHTISFISPL